MVTNLLKIYMLLHPFCEDRCKSKQSYRSVLGSKILFLQRIVILANSSAKAGCSTDISTSALIDS